MEQKTGCTLKQFNLIRFFKCCEAYEKNPCDIRTGLEIHYLKGQIPKRFYKYANLTWRKKNLSY